MTQRNIGDMTLKYLGQSWEGQLRFNHVTIIAVGVSGSLQN
jgi:hypothetical protein